MVILLLLIELHGFTLLLPDHYCFDADQVLCIAQNQQIGPSQLRLIHIKESSRLSP